MEHHGELKKNKLLLKQKQLRAKFSFVYFLFDDIIKIEEWGENKGSEKSKENLNYLDYSASKLISLYYQSSSFLLIISHLSSS